MDQVLRKKLRWMTLGGQYDWTKKLYPLETPPDFPSDVADLIRDIFPSMDPQAAIVNLYSPGDTLSLHRDVSEEVDKGLVSVSLGCDCLFIVGIEDPNHPSGFQHKTIRLRSGDALFMSKKARFAWHGVPKIIPNTCPEYLADWPNNDKYSFPDWANWMTTKRINLNVRQMRENLEPAERS
jgi:alkylated DNA repair protein alkB family protein 1